MKTVGVIAEYNPFHNGHKYHLQQVREQTKADVLVVIMSGNYVQRGEPALFDKWERTRQALYNGADIIIEMPFNVAVQPAHLFAKGAILQLQALGVEEISFGVEHPEYDFAALAKEASIISEAFSNYKQTFASIYYTQLAEKTGIKLESANDILALEYAKAIYEQNALIKIHPIKRIAAGYHDRELPINMNNAEVNIASATAIRQHLHDQRVVRYLPSSMDLTKSYPVKNFAVHWWPLLHYRLQTASLTELQQIYQLNDGLEHLFQETSYQVNEFQAFFDKVKSKRYSNARIQRTLLYTLLNVTTNEMIVDECNLQNRLLGYTSIGRAWLKRNKKIMKKPLISKINKDLRKNKYALQYRVDKIYQQFTECKQEQNIGRKPIDIENSLTIIKK
ncbi:putative nucleotidyltransferase [Weissella beninensis]|uniref:tRNA(Met) cytidine acetate ligase n=1 Tax=Periweissella beninensis TaxID=504936 RepID=A0ABT0VJI8_9LACO|nr:nucleotidyltransferase [Periweissella beninensis]MBM7544502.1 putative nucleotidyltransferase [Periweissella beninensis]MCM2438000.1 nucleotidyltransferase [Periweissella beninensis]